MKNSLGVLTDKYGLANIGFGCWYSYNGNDLIGVTAWTGENSRKGYVRVHPMEPGMVVAPTVEAAMEKLACLAL
jgi:hypothetical protein